MLDVVRDHETLTEGLDELGRSSQPTLLWLCSGSLRQKAEIIHATEHNFPLTIILVRGAQ